MRTGLDAVAQALLGFTSEARWIVDSTPVWRNHKTSAPTMRSLIAFGHSAHRLSRLGLALLLDADHVA
ncbi:hypothetical protein ACFYM2_15870 [Streptomyces sp. NPDC006711]|uniref:hypothetical protein n=1 Tax=Streptomyces sp. NPDC006711 TaxID=3364762 RepID=UPI0036C9BED7